MQTTLDVRNRNLLILNNKRMLTKCVLQAEQQKINKNKQKKQINKKTKKTNRIEIGNKQN